MGAVTTDVMRQLHADLSADLERIAARFKHCRITLVVRQPDLGDGDVLLSDDDVDEAIAAIQRLRDREAVT